MCAYARFPRPYLVKNIWQFMGDNRLSNRVFTSRESIIDHCCRAWNKLIDQPWRIRPSDDVVGAWVLTM